MQIKSIRFALAFLLYLFIASPVIAQTFPLDPNLWLLDPQQPDQGVCFTKKGSLAFNFPNGAITPDAFTGNLLLPWNQALTGATFTATVQVVTFPVGIKPVRFIPAPGPCVSPATVYLFFQTGSLYNGVEGTQWWSYLDAWPLADTGTATVTITVDLNDASRWYSVYGHPATMFPAEFANAKANSTYVGLTFGGDCHNGHGDQTGKGDAQFRLYSLTVQ